MTDDETARDIAEGHEPDDLARDPVEAELERDSTVPDPEEELLERDDTSYTEPQDE